MNYLKECKVRLSEIKIGDFVRVKSYDELAILDGRPYPIGGLQIPSSEKGIGSCYFNPKMERYCGLIMKVRDIIYKGIILENDPKWVFTPEMLDAVEQRTLNIPEFDELFG